MRHPTENWKMGTRSLTIFKEKDKEIAVMYKQFDGYPSGLGMDYYNHFHDLHIVNGLRMDGLKVANGMGCFACQVITVLKMTELERNQKNAKNDFTGGLRPESEWDKHYGMAGGVYLFPAGTRDCGENYIYTFYTEDCDDIGFNRRAPILMKLEYYDGVLFDAPLREFKDWLEKKEDEDEDE